MNIMEHLSNSASNDVILLLNSLLYRTTITVSGEYEDEIKRFINEILSLIPFRNIKIYNTDFENINEYNTLREKEQHNLNLPRSMYIAYPFDSDKLIEKISNFDSWIIGILDISQNQNHLEKIKAKVQTCQPYFLHVELKGHKIDSRFEGRFFPDFDISIATWIFESSIKNTERSIHKMEKMIRKKFKPNLQSKTGSAEVLDFSDERIELKYDWIKIEILKFYQASKKAFYILKRYKNASEGGLDSKIAAKELNQIITYKPDSIERIIHFISKEWGINFNDFVKFKNILSYIKVDNNFNKNSGDEINPCIIK